MMSSWEEGSGTEEVGMKFCRWVGTMADPQATGSEPLSQVCLQLQLLYLQREVHTAVQGAVGRLYKKNRCGRALSVSASISCPCHVSGAPTPVPLFLGISQIDNLPLLCRTFRRGSSVVLGIEILRPWRARGTRALPY